MSITERPDDNESKYVMSQVFESSREELLVSVLVESVEILILKVDPPTKGIVKLVLRSIPAGLINLMHGREHDSQHTMSRDREFCRLAICPALSPLGRPERFRVSSIVIRPYDSRAVDVVGGLAANPGITVQDVIAVPAKCM